MNIKQIQIFKLPKSEAKRACHWEDFLNSKLATRIDYTDLPVTKANSRSRNLWREMIVTDMLSRLTSPDISPYNLK